MFYTVDGTILLIAILLIVGVLTNKFSARFGVPSLVLYMMVGMLLSRFIYFDNARLTQWFGILALVIILFQGGLQTKWSHVKPVAKPAMTLATLGVILTALITGILAKYILGVTWAEGFLFGAIVGSTDAAAVFTVVGRQNIKTDIATTLEAESGSNDPMAILLTVTMIQFIQNPEFSIWAIVFFFTWQMLFGAFMGVIMGKLCVWAINRVNLDSSGLYPILSVGFAILAYSTTSLLNGSGMMAAYIMGIVVGNSDLTYKHSIFGFNEGFAWLMQILMFILMGLLVFPKELVAIAPQGLALSFLLMFVSRPIGVLISTFRMGFNKNELILICWSGLKGAVPIVLATYPLVAGIENSQTIFNVVFFVVITSCLIQGTSISPLARKLDLMEGEKIISPHSLELISISKTNSEIIEVYLPHDSAVINTSLADLQLPEKTLISALIRDNKVVTPTGITTLLAGDIIYVLLPKSEREQVKKIFLSKSKVNTSN